MSGLNVNTVIEILEREHGYEFAKKGEHKSEYEFLCDIIKDVLYIANEANDDGNPKKADISDNVSNSASIIDEINHLKKENALLRFMVDNGLGEEDMLNDITLPHEC